MPYAIFEDGSAGVSVNPTVASGLRGHHGWSMVTTPVSTEDGTFLRVVDWTGGEGIKPDVGAYVGAAGLVADIADAAPLDVVARVNGQSGDVMLVSDDIGDEDQTKKFTSAEGVTKLANLTLSGPIDLDAIGPAVAAKLSKSQNLADLADKPAAVANLGIPALISAAIEGLINGAPGALDALNELAAALGDDPNFAATVAAQIAAKADSSALAALIASLGTMAPENKADYLDQATFNPNNKTDDAFDMAAMDENPAGDGALALRNAERAKLGDTGRTVANRAALGALDPSKDTSAYLGEAGFEGRFSTVDPAGYAALIAADTVGGEIVPTANPNLSFLRQRKFGDYFKTSECGDDLAVALGG